LPSTIDGSGSKGSVEQIKECLRTTTRWPNPFSIRGSASPMWKRSLPQHAPISRHGGERGYYNLTEDFVQMPPFEAFRDPESYCDIRA